METNTSAAMTPTKKSKSHRKPKEVETEEMEVDVMTQTTTPEKTKKKKSSSSSKHTPSPKEKEKSKKKKIDSSPAPVSEKKRKASAVAPLPEMYTPEKIMEWLEKLSLRSDLKQIKTLHTHQPKYFSQLLALMNDAPKGLIYSYLVKTPLGRMFWFDTESNKFKSVRDDLNLIILRDYDKESSLNIFATVHSLTTEQRAELFEFLGVTEAQSSKVEPEQWLFALIETNILERRKEKPDYTQCVEPCLFHDIDAKKTYWLGSKAGKFRLNTVIVSRARQITAKNIEAEYITLASKRLEIAAFLKKVTSLPSSNTITIGLSGDPVVPKKRQKTEAVAAVPSPKTQARETPKMTAKAKAKAEKVLALERQEQQLLEAQRLKESMSAVLHKKLAELEDSDKSTPTSESSSFSFSDDEDAVPKISALEDSRRKQKLTLSASSSSSTATTSTTSTTTTTKKSPNAAAVVPKEPVPSAKTVEMNKNMEEARRSHKFLNEQFNPKVDYFRTTCT